VLIQTLSRPDIIIHAYIQYWPYQFYICTWLICTLFDCSMIVYSRFSVRFGSYVIDTSTALDDYVYYLWRRLNITLHVTPVTKLSTIIAWVRPTSSLPNETNTAVSKNACIIINMVEFLLLNLWLVRYSEIYKLTAENSKCMHASLRDKVATVSVSCLINTNHTI
jgi:hypothetical protein